MMNIWNFKILNIEIFYLLIPFVSPSISFDFLKFKLSIYILLLILHQIGIRAQKIYPCHKHTKTNLDLPNKNSSQVSKEQFYLKKKKSEIQKNIYSRLLLTHPTHQLFRPFLTLSTCSMPVTYNVPMHIDTSTFGNVDILIPILRFILQDSSSISISMIRL